MVIFHSLYSHSFQSNPPWIAQFFHHEMLRDLGIWTAPLVLCDWAAKHRWMRWISYDDVNSYIYTKIWNAWHASNMIPLLIYIIDDMYNNIHTHNIYMKIHTFFVLPAACQRIHWVFLIQLPASSRNSGRLGLWCCTGSLPRLVGNRQEDVHQLFWDSIWPFLSVGVAINGILLAFQWI